MCKYCDNWIAHDLDDKQIQNYLEKREPLPDFVVEDRGDVSWIEGFWEGSEDGFGDIYPNLVSFTSIAYNPDGSTTSATEITYCPFCGEKLK